MQRIVGEDKRDREYRRKSVLKQYYTLKCGNFLTSNVKGYAKVEVYNVSGYLPKECEIKVDAIKVKLML
ncbi:MAG: hypothetical protein RXR43_04545 [Sulfolobus sp.]